MSRLGFFLTSPACGGAEAALAAVLREKNAKAKLRLWRWAERGGWRHLSTTDFSVLLCTPTPTLPRKREREQGRIAMA